MTIKLENFGRPLTVHSMSSASEKGGKRPRRQTMGASRLPQSTFTANVSSKFRLPTPSALPRSVSFFTSFNKSAHSNSTGYAYDKPSTLDEASQPHRSRSGWQPRQSTTDLPTRTAIPSQVQKREPSVPIPQRGLMSQIQPLPSLPHQTITFTHHRDQSIDDITEVTSSKSMMYWLGRYVSVSDKLRDAALPDLQNKRSLSPIPSFQIVRSVSTPPNTNERTFPTRNSSKTTRCDHQHAMHDRDQRDKLAFALLKEYCLTNAAKDSLAEFIDVMVDARVAKGDDKVGLLRGIGKGLRSTSLAKEKKGWLDGLKGKKIGVRHRT